jgi:hypothetical protein
VTLLSIALALCTAIVPVSAQAVAQHYQLHIPRQPLDTALKDFARQTGLQIAHFSDTINGSAMVGPITGEFSVQQALSSLLTPSGLTYKLVNDQTIAIVQPQAPPSSTLTGTGQSAPTTPTALDASDTPDADADKKSTDRQASKNSFWGRLRLAQLDQGASSKSSSPNGKQPPPPGDGSNNWKATKYWT